MCGRARHREEHIARRRPALARDLEGAHRADLPASCGVIVARNRRPSCCGHQTPTDAHAEVLRASGSSSTNRNRQGSLITVAEGAASASRDRALFAFARWCREHQRCASGSPFVRAARDGQRWSGFHSTAPNGIAKHFGIFWIPQTRSIRRSERIGNSHFGLRCPHESDVARSRVETLQVELTGSSGTAVRVTEVSAATPPKVLVIR